MGDIYLYEIEGLKFEYNNNFSLEISNFRIPENTSTGFTGPNGSGKSTFLKILAFLEHPVHGSIKYKGRETNSNEPGIRNRVTMLLQDAYLLKKSVFENIAYGLKIRGDTENLKPRVFDALNWVGLQGKIFAHRRWNELSGGESQRVALASRLILKPEVLILDEPTVSVDMESVSLIKKAIDFFRKEYNTSMIISSHDSVWLNSVTDNILRIYEGRFAGAGDENLIDGPWHYKCDDLWEKKLEDNQSIYATIPPAVNSIAILGPSDIMISMRFPQDISAQNKLQGRVINMKTSNKIGNVSLEINIANILLKCDITRHAAKELRILPGNVVWVVFKATSLRWQ